MKNAIGISFIFIGSCFLLFTLYLIWQRNTPRRLEFSNYINSNSEAVSSTNVIPIILEIPAIQISLPILSQELTAGHWPATSEGVTYLGSSPIPGDTGNSIMYGHNWPNILGKLPKVKPGDNIKIILSNGSTEVFVIEYVTEVTPDQTHILNPTADKRLTLYTCTGFLDSRRLVVTAILQ
ncbi:MAG: sortase [Patescibacteria group bacterium]